MLFITKFSKIVLALLLVSTFSFAQKKQQETEAVKEFKSKVSELYTKYKLDGFVTYKGGDIPMENKSIFPIFVDLKEGSWYQFVVIGDPNAIKFEMQLGIEGNGNIITDRFKTDNVGEYWTQFSFICPRSGKYLLTFYQRGSSRKMLAHVGILERPRQSEQGILTFKH